MIRPDFLKKKVDFTGNGTISRKVGAGRYTLVDGNGQRHDVRSAESLAVGDRVLFRAGWIMSRSGDDKVTKTYSV